MMRLMVTRYNDSTEDEVKSINSFRRNNIQLYLQNLDARSGWQTLIWLVLITFSEIKFCYTWSKFWRRLKKIQLVLNPKLL